MSIGIHMCISVRGVLSKPKQVMWKDYKGVFTKDDGSATTYEEVRDYLLDELAKGHELIPFGKCDNFNYAKGGCRGHEEKDLTPTLSSEGEGVKA